MSDNEDTINDVISLISVKLSKNEDIDLNEVLSFVDVSSNISRLRKYVLDNKICSKSEWKAAVSAQKAIDLFGAYPTSVSNFLDLWVEKHEIKINYKGHITTKQVVFHSGVNITTDIHNVRHKLETSTSERDKKDLESTLRLYENTIDCMRTQTTIDDIARRMRLVSKEFGLRYTSSDIEDAIKEWVINEQPKRKFEIYTHLMYQIDAPQDHHRAEDEWIKLADAIFDYTDASQGMTIAAIQKFMWQVKGKMIGRNITNHLMPVLLGPQGVGKSTFIEMLIADLHELTASTDFNQITDDRNIELWGNYTLVLDEMGFASRSDIDVVKHLVTTNILNRRVMKTNMSVSVEQKATFIGASNKELAQLIRDETGNRRFIGLRFKNKPDWKALNEINFKLLWQSVDERGKDPMIPYTEELRAAQEKTRSKRSCEEWVETLTDADIVEKFETDSIWYLRYKEWERQHYERFRMDLNEWRLEMKRLISHAGGDFPFVNQHDTNNFKFIGQHAVNKEELFVQDNEQEEPKVDLFFTRLTDEERKMAMDMIKKARLADLKDRKENPRPSNKKRDKKIAPEVTKEVSKDETKTSLVSDTEGSTAIDGENKGDDAGKIVEANPHADVPSNFTVQSKEKPKSAGSDRLRELIERAKAKNKNE